MLVDICHPSSVTGISAKLHISASLVPGTIVCMVLCAARRGKNIHLQQPCAVCYFTHYTDREVGRGGRTGRWDGEVGRGGGTPSAVAHDLTIYAIKIYFECELAAGGGRGTCR